jgi:hypothetical protein
MEVYTRGVVEEVLREKFNIPPDRQLFFASSGMVIVALCE